MCFIPGAISNCHEFKKKLLGKKNNFYFLIPGTIEKMASPAAKIYELEDRLREIRNQRAVLSASTKEKLSMLAQMSQTRVDSMKQCIQSLEQQNKRASERNRKLLEDVLLAANRSSTATNLSSPFANGPDSPIGRPEQAVRLQNAKKSFLTKLEQSLPLYHRSEVFRLEEQRRKLMLERVQSQQRRERLKHELTREEIAKEAMEYERREVVRTLAMEQQDLLESKLHSLALVEQGQLADREIYEEVLERSMSAKDALSLAQQYEQQYQPRGGNISGHPQLQQMSLPPFSRDRGSSNNQQVPPPPVPAPLSQQQQAQAKVLQQRRDQLAEDYRALYGYGRDNDNVTPVVTVDEVNDNQSVEDVPLTFSHSTSNKALPPKFPEPNNNTSFKATATESKSSANVTPANNRFFSQATTGGTPGGGGDSSSDEFSLSASRNVGPSPHATNTQTPAPAPNPTANTTPIGAAVSAVKKQNKSESSDEFDFSASPSLSVASDNAVNPANTNVTQANRDITQPKPIIAGTGSVVTNLNVTAPIGNVTHSARDVTAPQSDDDEFDPTAIAPVSVPTAASNPLNTSMLNTSLNTSSSVTANTSFATASEEEQLRKRVSLLELSRCQSTCIKLFRLIEEKLGDGVEVDALYSLGGFSLAQRVQALQSVADEWRPPDVGEDLEGLVVIELLKAKSDDILIRLVRLYVRIDICACA